MSSSVLVAHATRYGSTQEVADRAWASDLAATLQPAVAEASELAQVNEYESHRV